MKTWTVRKMGRSRYSRIEIVWQGPEDEAKALAEQLTMRWGPEIIYWAQRPTDFRSIGDLQRRLEEASA